MPRTVRDDTKRKIDRAIGNLDWAGKHLAEIIITYQEPHPEIAEPLRDAATVIAELQNLIRKVGRQI